ncbi:helix-turn-helix transcriptional regulator [Thioflexithrix psekupsensis]|nr:helix-turn-helix transcriptional regulator [Thioflexithrix psekupsensis]
MNSMLDSLPPFLNVKQVADYLQLHEKKVYSLLNEGQIPATKVTGKWLFPRELIDQWLLDNSYAGVFADRLLIAGADDPLLYRMVALLSAEWQEQALMAHHPTPVQWGLSLLAQRRVDAAVIHWGPSVESHLRHAALIQQYPQHSQWLIIRLFEREQGLLFSPKIAHYAQLPIEQLLQKSLHWVTRQEGSGTQWFLLELLARYHVKWAELTRVTEARSVREVGGLLITQQADIAVGSRAMAHELGLTFMALDWEAIDVALNRGVYFRHLFQQFLAFLQTPATQALSQSLRGYRLDRSGKMIWSG